MSILSHTSDIKNTMLGLYFKRWCDYSKEQLTKKVIFIQKLYRGWIQRQTILYNKIINGELDVYYQLELYDETDTVVELNIPKYLQSSFLMLKRRLLGGYFNKGDIIKVFFRRISFISVKLILFIQSFNIRLFESFMNNYLFKLPVGEYEDECKKYSDSVDIYYIINITAAFNFFICDSTVINSMLKKMYSKYFNTVATSLINKIFLLIIDKKKIVSEKLTPEIKNILLVNCEFLSIFTYYVRREFLLTLTKVLVLEFIKNNDIIENEMKFIEEYITIKDNPIMGHFDILLKDMIY